MRFKKDPTLGFDEQELWEFKNISPDCVEQTTKFLECLGELQNISGIEKIPETVSHIDLGYCNAYKFYITDYERTDFLRGNKRAEEIYKDKGKEGKEFQEVVFKAISPKFVFEMFKEETDPYVFVHVNDEDVIHELEYIMKNKNQEQISISAETIAKGGLFPTVEDENYTVEETEALEPISGV